MKGKNIALALSLMDREIALSAPESMVPLKR